MCSLHISDSWVKWYSRIKFSSNLKYIFLQKWLAPNASIFVNWGKMVVMCKHNQITFTHYLLNIAVLIYIFKIITSYLTYIIQNTGISITSFYHLNILHFCWNFRMTTDGIYSRPASNLIIFHFLAFQSHPSKLQNEIGRICE